MKELLATSENYKIFGAYEEAHLTGKNIPNHIVVGDFYGHVECACIDKSENWCVTAGQLETESSFISY